MTRAELCSHNTPFVEAFCNDAEKIKSALVADGTYLRCEKSSNNQFQRLSYSVQKKSCLVKPFLICTVDGYIIDIYGLYPATCNDARILTEIMEKDLHLRKLLLEGDILILDRGLRDTLVLLRNKYHLETMMPSLLPQKQKQFTTHDANESRLCTKLRWVVEGVNGLLKSRFRVFDNRVENKSLSHFLEDIRIAGALLNKFSKRLLSDKVNALEMAKNMLLCRNKENELSDLVSENGLHRKSQFVEIACNETELADFPKLSIERMQNEITFGSYQLSHSLSYLAEQFAKNDIFSLFSSKHTLTQKAQK